jgi:hypothetical protein
LIQFRQNYTGDAITKEATPSPRRAMTSLASTSNTNRSTPGRSNASKPKASRTANASSKMKLSPDKLSLWINASLTLTGIPPETSGYRLGSRSAPDWIGDQYQVEGESDPNREDDPG